MNQVTHVYPETVSEVMKFLENPNAKLVAVGTAIARSNTLPAKIEECVKQ